MDRAWTRGAEEILSNIQRENRGENKPKIGPSSPPPPGDENIEISKIKIDLTGGGFAKTGGDLIDRTFAKIGSSFRIAAASRRAFKMSGGDPRSLRRGYFLSKAAKAEFGGDFMRRTRGTFSSAPDATQDPGLSKEQRFAEVLKRDLADRPQMMRQEELFDVDKYTDKTALQAITDAAKKTADKILGLESGFVKIEKNSKETSSAFVKIRQNLSEVRNTFVKTADHYKEVVDNKEQVIKIKEKIRDFTKKQSEEKEQDQKESQLELIQDTASVTDVKEVDQGLDQENIQADDGGGSLLDRIGDGLDFVEGRDLRFSGKRFRGARRRLLRRKMGGIGRGISGRLGGVGKGIGGVATGVGKSVSKVGSGIGKGIGKIGTKIGSKLGGSLLKKIPGVGLVLGGLASIDRFKSGDVIGGLGEIGSGVASIFPGIGTAISLGIDAALIGKDVADESKKPPTKLSGGGIIAGEAGNEAVIPLSAAPAKKALAGIKGGGMGSTLGSVGPLLSSVAGIVRNPLYGAILGPTVNPILQPMMAKYKVPVYSADLGVFKASKLKSSTTQAKGKAESAKKSGDNPMTSAFGWMGNLFGGIGGAASGAIGSVGNFFRNLFGGGGKGKNGRGRNVRGVPLGKGETATGSTIMNGLVKRGFTKEEAAAIVGNLWAESGFRTGAVNSTSGAFGLMQWAYGRKDTLMRRAAESGKSATDLEFQLDHIAWELRGGDRYETSQFKKAMAYGSDVPSKTRGFAYEVERASSGELSSSMPKRIGAAESVYKVKSSSPAPSAAAPRAAKTGDTKRASTPSSMSGAVASSISPKSETTPQPVAMSPGLRDEHLYGSSSSVAVLASSNKVLDKTTTIIKSDKKSGLGMLDIQIMSLG
jgi:hypothetical protein